MVRTIFVDKKPGQPGFFSVRRQVSINGVKYRPAVCYEMADMLAAAVRGMAAKGEATVYTEMHVFVTGRAVPVSQMKLKNLSGISPTNVTWAEAEGQKTPEDKAPEEGGEF
jgi:pyruvate dehydrogenase complex dehydrogenase (E1) component